MQRKGGQCNNLHKKFRVMFRRTLDSVKQEGSALWAEKPAPPKGTKKKKHLPRRPVEKGRTGDRCPLQNPFFFTSRRGCTLRGGISPKMQNQPMDPRSGRVGLITTCTYWQVGCLRRTSPLPTSTKGACAFGGRPAIHAASPASHLSNVGLKRPITHRAGKSHLFKPSCGYSSSFVSFHSSSSRIRSMNIW